MANTYYNSQLTAAEIEAALEAIDGVIVPANNGKVLAINNGKIEARSVQWGGGGTVLEPLSVTANGDYTPEAGVDGFDEVHVSVPNSYSASDEGKVVSNGALVAQTARASQITQNGTYDTTLNDENKTIAGDLTNEEIQILGHLMKQEWLDTIIHSWERNIQSSERSRWIFACDSQRFWRRWYCAYISGKFSSK